jgi:hypothetical protein
MTIQDQIPHITSSIDNGQLCTLGLVTVYSANPSDLRMCHQVVAHNYEWLGSLFVWRSNPVGGYKAETL